MKIQPAVWEETRKIALGTAALTAVMLLVFLLLGKMDGTVLLGALLGYAVAVGNFFLMALSVQKAAEKMEGADLPPLGESVRDAGENPEKSLSPEAQDAKRGMRFSYMGRMLLMAVAVIVPVKSPSLNAVAAIVPIFFPRLVIAFEGIWMKKKDKQA